MSDTIELSQDGEVNLETVIRAGFPNLNFSETHWRKYHDICEILYDAGNVPKSTKGEVLFTDGTGIKLSKHVYEEKRTYRTETSYSAFLFDSERTIGSVNLHFPYKMMPTLRHQGRMVLNRVGARVGGVAILDKMRDLKDVVGGLAEEERQNVVVLCQITMKLHLYLTKARSSQLVQEELTRMEDRRYPLANPVSVSVQF